MSNPAFSRSPWDVVGQYVLEADPATARNAINSMARETAKGTREMAAALQKAMNPTRSEASRRFWKQRHADLQKNFSQSNRMWRDYWKHIAQEESRANKHRRDQEVRDDKTAQKGEQERLIQHERRITQTQAAADRDRLRAAQAVDKRAAEEDRRTTSSQVHEQRKRELAIRKHGQIVVKTWASFLSNVRTTNETAQRAIVNAFQAHWRRIHADRRHNQSIEIQEMKRHGDAQNAVLRGSYADQERIVSRSQIRQQGLIASSQARIQHGVLGGFLNLRNVLLGAGTFLSARAIFGNLQEYEQTRVSFTNLLGSVEAATSMLADLQQFNVETPFNLPAITSSAKQLLAMGENAHEIIPDLTAIGDVGAKFSATANDVQGVVRALGQMSQAARVNAQDINQIQQRFVGFNARAAIARGLGISVADAMDQIASGAITGNEGMNALIAGMHSEENAAGAMDEQMATLTGRLSNFGDELYGLQIQFLGPFIDEMASAVEQVTLFIDSLFRGSGIWTIIRSGLLGIAAALGVLLAGDLLGQLRLGLLALAAHPIVIGFVALGAAVSIIVRDFPQLLDPFREFASTVRTFAIDKLDAITEFWAGIAPVVQESAGMVADAFGQLFSGDFSGFGDAIAAAASKIGATLQPLFNTVKDVFVNAFETAKEWITSGGVDQIVAGFIEMMGNVVSTVRTRIGDLIRGDLFLPILAGLAPFLLSAITGIGLGPILLAGLAAAFLAISPRTREVIFGFFQNIWANLSDWMAHTLPGLFLEGMHALGAFLGGPVVRTILSEGVLRVAVGVAGAAVAGGVAFIDGFVDGLKHALPDAVNAIRGIFNDLAAAAAAALGNIPVIGDALQLLLVPLQGILPIVAAFTRLIEMLPTPLILAAGAVALLAKNWSSFKKAGSAVAGVTRKVGSEIALMGTYARVGGSDLEHMGLTKTSKAMSGLGKSVEFVGDNIAALATGVLVLVGAWEQHQQRIKAIEAAQRGYNRAIRDGVSDGRNYSDIVRSQIEATDGMTEALSNAGVSTDEFVTALLGGGDAQQQFLAVHGEATQAEAAFAEQTDNASKALLDQYAAEHRLTDAQQDLVRQIDEGVNTGETYTSVVRDVADAEAAAERAASSRFDSYSEKIRGFISDADQGSDSASSFSDALGEMAGQRIGVERAILGIQDSVSQLKDAMQDFSNAGELRDEFVGVADSIVTIVSALSEAGRTPEAEAAFGFFREGLVQQYQQLGLNRDAAEQFTDALLPNVAEIRRRIDEALQAQIQPLLRARRNLQNRLLTEENEQRREAIQGLLNDTEAALAAFDPPDITSTVNLNVEDVHWDQTVAQWERLFHRGQVDIGVRVHASQGGGGGAPRNFAGLTGGGAGTGIGGGGVPSLGPPATGQPGAVGSWQFWASGVTTVLTTLVETFRVHGQDMVKHMNLTQTTITTNFKRWGVGMVSAARSIGEEIANALATELKAGTIEVGGIINEYAARLSHALNPILRAIGEDPISIAAHAKGAFSPTLAEGHDGPQVHVFNEAGQHGEMYVPFDPRYRGRARNIAEKGVGRLGGHVQWFAEGGLNPGAIRRGQSFARAQAGKPYVWGGVGPNGYDCSGLASAIVNAIRGQNPYSRLFTSASLVAGASAGLVPGLGQVSIGARSGSPGHVTSNIAGLKAESTDGSVRIGPAALDPAVMPSKWHIGSGVYIGADGVVYPLPNVPAIHQLGQVGQVGAKAMQHVARLSRLFADMNTYTGTPVTGSENPLTGQLSGPVPPALLAGIRRAMSIVGVPANWLGPLLTLISRESGYNPRAFNSQTVGGEHASGLMQTLPSTFRANALPGYANIFGVIDNVIAGLRYILGRYGSIFNVGQAVGPNPTSGYRLGGYVPQDGPAMIHRGEFVIPADLTRALGGSKLNVTDLRAALMSGSTNTQASSAPVVGEQNIHIHSNASEPEAIAVHVNAKLRSIVSGVRVGG